MKITFLLSFIPNPRMERRIELLKTNYEVNLIYWNRSLKEKPFKLAGVKTYEVALKADFHLKNLFTRVIKTLRFRAKALKLLKKLNPELIYVQNIDMLSIAYKYQKRKKVKIIYEIADISSLVIDKQKEIFRKLFSYFLK